jgi:hypothetical protein
LLIPERGSPNAEWLLEWDQSVFTLKDPDGQSVVRSETVGAHWLVDTYALYQDGKVALITPLRVYTFQRQATAAADLCDLVKSALQRDPAYRRSLAALGRWTASWGLAFFVFSGGLFGAYCWWAYYAPDPPPGHWIHQLGWLVQEVLRILLGVAIVSFGICWFGLLELWRVRRIERAEPDASVDTPP